ncbi:MAG: FGGY family carbohydrate kinase [Clostridia bacterium]
MTYTIGIDIGFTKIRGVLIELSTKRLVDSITRSNSTEMPSEMFESLQDPDEMFKIAKDIIDDLMNDLNGDDFVSFIGLTGQMHGMTYVDENGAAVSPFFTWKDKRGDRNYKNDVSYASYIKAVTLRPSVSGYGLVTHFYNVENGVVPPNAAKLTTIQGYVAMKLSNSKIPILHMSDAASLGLYDVENNCFDLQSIKAVGLDEKILPIVSTEVVTVGQYKSAKVICPIGDNQASFFGSVTEDNSVFVNIGGTGQVSIEIPYFRPAGHLEERPYFDGKYLLVGTSICGGYAYEMLKNFYIDVFKMFDVKPPEDLYSTMNMSAFEAYKQGNPLCVDTQFCGSKIDPTKRGSITDITIENFNPTHLSLGMLAGISEELYQIIESDLPSDFTLVGGGKGVKRNTLMQKLLSEKFNKAINIPQIEDEAAFGASLISLKIKK